MHRAMSPSLRIVSRLFCALYVAVLVQAAHAQTVSVYRGMCDASAGIALGPDHFVVADDERNALKIYRRNDPAPQSSSLDLSEFLGTEPDKESDLEGAAMVGSRIYWISSHGANSKGKVQERRRRFFATEVNLQTTPPTLTTVGKPYSELLADLQADPKLAKYKLHKAAKRPPESPGGLNIEGLAATGDGELLIGFRNPLPASKALVIPLKNPERVVAGKKAKFGKPMEINLGGRGIRSIERVGADYLIVAGPSDDNGSFALYRWSGRADDDPVELKNVDLAGLNPEGLFAIPQTDSVQILSDDGGVMIEGKECKKQEVSKQSFRSIVIKP